MKKTRDYLKNIFSTGAKPTQQNFSDQFDSFVHLDDGVLIPLKINSVTLINGRNIIVHNQNRKPIQVTFIIDDIPVNFDWKRTDGLSDCDPLNKIVVFNGDVDTTNVEVNII